MMKQTWLKWIRVVSALIFIVLITLIFIDYDRIGETPLETAVLYSQFVPSLLLFSETLAWTATGFLVVLVVTFLFGRIYCSAICPLGILQDIIIRISDKLRKPRKVKYRYKKPYNILRYGILALTVGLFLSGSTLVLSLLDPFSNYGRIASDLLRPIYVVVHNGYGQLLESFGAYGSFPLQWKSPSFIALVFPVLFLIGLIWLTVRKGRLFCNTLCPVGTLLGLVSRFSLYKIRIPKSTCTLCAKCSIHCKAGCIHLKSKEVDFSRCIACFDCISVCDLHGIGYARTPWLKSEPESQLLPQIPAQLLAHPTVKPNPERRALVRGAAVTLVGLAGLSGSGHGDAKPHNRVPSTVANQRTFPVAPPGAGDIARYNDLCTACHLCVSACPYGVLQPSFLDYGLSGLLQPHLDFISGYCSYECNRCGQVCPTGAIQPLALDAKQGTQLGIVKFIRENCVVYTDHTACGACDEYCPTKAVHMIPYQDGLTIPEVRESLCVGCGACENACPVRPYRAIFVDGHPVHQLAQRPDNEPLNHKVQSDFPF